MKLGNDKLRNGFLSIFSAYRPEPKDVGYAFQLFESVSTDADLSPELQSLLRRACEEMLSSRGQDGRLALSMGQIEPLVQIIRLIDTQAFDVEDKASESSATETPNISIVN